MKTVGLILAPISIDVAHIYQTSGVSDGIVLKFMDQTFSTKGVPIKNTILSQIPVSKVTTDIFTTSKCEGLES